MRPARIVDHDLEPPGAELAGFRHRAVDVGGVGDVPRDGAGVGAEVAGEPRRALAIEVHECHPRPFGGEASRNAGPEAGGGAGDECGFALKTHGFLPLLFLPMPRAAPLPPAGRERAGRASVRC